MLQSNGKHFRGDLRLHDQWRPFILIYLAAFAVRGVYIIIAPWWPISWADSATYLAIASHFTQPGAAEALATEGPGYPAFLALVAFITHFNIARALPLTSNSLLATTSPTEWFWPFRWAQCVIGASVPVSVFATCKFSDARNSQTIGLVAAAILCVYPAYVLYANALLSENVGIPLLWASVAFLMYARSRLSIKHAAIAGTLLGMACLARVTITYCAFLIPFALWFGWQKSTSPNHIRAVAAFVAPLAFLILGWSSWEGLRQTQPILGLQGFQSRWITLSNAIQPMQFGWGEDRIAFQATTPSSYMIYSHDVASPGQSQDAVVHNSNQRELTEFGTLAHLVTFRVPYEILKYVAGNRVKIFIRGNSNEGFPVPLRARYVATGRGSSPWRSISIGTDATVSFDYDVPLDPLANDDEVQLNADAPGGHASLHIEDISIRLFYPPNSFAGMSRRWLRVAALVFTNDWFGEDWGNLAHGKALFPKATIHGFQHLLMLFGITGFSWALVEWRRWFPVVAILGAMVMTGAAYVEVRHNLPFVPALSILTGLQADAIADMCTRQVRSSTLVRVALLILAVALIGLGLSRAAVAPFDRPPLYDLAIPMVLLGIAVLFFADFSTSGRFQNAGSRIRIALCGIIPSAIFLLGYGAYASFLDSPRWRYHHIELPAAESFVQQIHLDKPIDLDKVNHAYLLLDLSSPSRNPPLEIRVNGKRLSIAANEWQHPYPLGAHADKDAYPFFYKTLSDFYGVPITSWPQWWMVPIDAQSIAGKRQIDVSVSRLDGANASMANVPVKIGVVAGYMAPHVMEGPSLTRTALSRWRVLDDWRFWETSRVSSSSVSSSEGPDDHSASPANPLPPLDVTLGIRVLIRDGDGEATLY